LAEDQIFGATVNVTRNCLLDGFEVIQLVAIAAFNWQSSKKSKLEQPSLLRFFRVQAAFAT